MIVTLTPYERWIACMAGIARNLEQTAKAAPQPLGAPPRGQFEVHIIGALGECAVAKALGLYWPGKGVLRDADVGADIQVRCSEGGRSLILHESDRDDALFYFVRKGVDTYDFTIHEPVRGLDGKRPEFWRQDKNVRPAFFVPVVPLNAASRRHRPVAAPVRP